MDEARTFITRLGADPSTSLLTFQVIPEYKSRGIPKVLNGTFDELEDSLREENARGCGIFLTINETDGKGRLEENIVRVRAAFCDFDGSPLPEDGFPVEPTMLVATSVGKFHAYWVASDIPLEAFTPLQQAMARMLGSDPIPCDLPRVMRLPGFDHRKGEPQLVQLLIDDGPTSDFVTLREAFKAGAQQKILGLDPEAQGDLVKLMRPLWVDGSKHHLALGMAAILLQRGWVPKDVNDLLDLCAGQQMGTGFHAKEVRTTAARLGKGEKVVGWALLDFTGIPQEAKDHLRALVSPEDKRAQIVLSNDEKKNVDAVLRALARVPDVYMNGVGLIVQTPQGPHSLQDRDSFIAEAVKHMLVFEQVAEKEESSVTIPPVLSREAAKAKAREEGLAGGEADHRALELWLAAKAEREEAKTKAAAEKSKKQRKVVKVAVPFPERLARLVTRSSRTDVLRAGVPELRNVVWRPVIAPSGDVISGGYEPEGRVLSLCGVPDYVPPKTRDEAVETLLDPFVDFPFANEASKAVIVSALLTMACRELIYGPVPGLAVRSTTAGTGKSLILKALGVINSGRVPATPSMPATPEEMKKLVTSVLVQKDHGGIHIFDNVVGSFGNDTLDALLTSETWTDRVLGLTKMVTLTNDPLWCVTGNGISVTGDGHRRWLWCSFMTDDERPELREGFKHPNIIEHLRKSRGRILAAAHWAVRQVVVGEVREGKALGSYESWSRLILGAVAGLGLPDPFSAVPESACTGAEDWGQLLEIWRTTFPEPVYLGVVWEALKGGMSEEFLPLSSAFQDVGLDAQTPMGFGRKLSSYIGRVGGGLRLQKKKTSNGALYSVEEVK